MSEGSTPDFAQKCGAEGQKFVIDRAVVQRLDAEKIAEINQPVAHLKTVGQMVMQRRKTINIAMNGGNGPNAARSAKLSEFFVHGDTLIECRKLPLQIHANQANQ